MSTEKDCFGFYGGTPVCSGCRAQKRCQAILVSDGFNLVAGTIDQLLADLPENGQYFDTDRVPELVSQLLFPPTGPKSLNPDQEDLLDLLERKGISEKGSEEVSKAVLNRASSNVRFSSLLAKKAVVVDDGHVDLE